LARPDDAAVVALPAALALGALLLGALLLEELLELQPAITAVAARTATGAIHRFDLCIIAMPP
jgi:hypothetical protein